MAPKMSRIMEKKPTSERRFGEAESKANSKYLRFIFITSLSNIFISSVMFLVFAHADSASLRTMNLSKPWKASLSRFLIDTLSNLK